jgi:hypothetical protein
MFFNKRSALLFSFALMLLTAPAALAASSPFWRQINDSDISRRPMNRTPVPTNYAAFAINKQAVLQALDAAPLEFTTTDQSGAIIELPMPDGSMGRFRIVRSPIAEAGLIAKYPELGRTYSGQGIDDPAATAKIDFLSNGFHAMILSPGGTVMVDPYAQGDVENYVAYYKRELPRMSDFECSVGSGFDAISRIDPNNAIPDSSAPEVISGSTLRTYRLALAATFEYCNAVGGNTIAGCLAAQTVVMNRVNGVYERDLAIRMVMIANNNLLAYAGNNTGCGGVACTSANDPYTNNNGSTMLGQNQTNLDTVIGTGNYDIGHVFSTGGGGIASLNSPCNPGNKAQGVTGLPSPLGDPFAIDYVAHEMGHQWGSNHTFNATVGSCGGNRSNLNSVEPGSGITVMGYAGICGAQDLAPNSIDTFHVRSLEVIVNYSQVGNGNSCAAATATGNTPPTVTLTGGSTWNIPKQTPFSLSATATDPDGDSLTYDWQQYNAGGSTGAATVVPNSDADGTPRPLFRNYVGQTSGTRFFPSLQFIRNNANVPPNTTGGFMTGELLPAITRTMTFQVLVRDNRANGGGINSATSTVNVDGASGPFDVTAPNTAVSWTGNAPQTVTWNVANTNAAPVSAAAVKISFSTDGGLTFPTTILASTPNDGSEVITVPNVATTQGRIKVEAVGNIFFDMSNVNFTVVAGPTATIRAPFDYDGDDKTDLSIFRPSVGQWWLNRSSTGTTPAYVFGSSTDRLVPADYTGDQKTDVAFWRPSTGEWYILRSEDTTFYAAPFGANGDRPIPGDYDADGKADLAVHRASTNTWYILKSAGGTDILPFGAAGDTPVVGDYDGDSKTDIAIYRTALGQWWIRRSSDGNTIVVNFGNSSDKPVQGYYTADNKMDVAFWRPSTGEWYIVRSEDNSFYAFPFGANGDIPVPGDYDGDDRFDAGVFRPSSNTWFVNRTTAGTLIQAFGSNGDVPTPSVFVP